MKTDLSQKVIIPVAGGKGGVGKSLFTANLARELAILGGRTIAVDLDLGGSNLHSHFGLHNQHPGIGDYLNMKGSKLSEYIVSLDLDDLYFIPGDGISPFLANINYAQKQKLMRDLDRLDTDYLLLDLGSGSSFNILDFFRMSNQGIVVTTPDYPAIMNMLAFLKNAVLRTISRGVGTNCLLRNVLVEACSQTIMDEMVPVPEIIYKLSEINPQVAIQIHQKIKAFDLKLIVNKVNEDDDLEFVEKVVASLQNKLGIKVELLASFSEKEESCWRWAAKQNTLPFLEGVDDVVYSFAQNQSKASAISA